MITYKKIFNDIEVPVLHKVKYTPGVPPDSHIVMIDQWCARNCKANYYRSPAWTDTFIEFEDDEDAVLFALRWAGKDESPC